jgi:hypothetical protein
MAKITDEDLGKLENTKSDVEWDAVCDAIKKKYGGYPENWYPKVILSGFAARVAAKWGGSAEIHVVPLLQVKP